MYSIKRKVAMSDVGADNRLKIVSMLESFGDCEQFQIDDTPYITDYFSSNNFGLYVGFRQIDIYSMPEYGSEFSVVTGIYEVGKVMGYRNTCAYDSSGNIISKSYTMGATVDLKTQKATRVSNEYIDGFKADEKVDMEYTSRKVILPQCEPIKLKEFNVPSHFIDNYKHMNNVNYIAVALACLGVGYNPKRIRVEYKLSARAGESITPYLYKVNGKSYVSLVGVSGVFCNVEFCDKI